MNIPVLTLVHISASVAALTAGLLALGRLLSGKAGGTSTQIFLAGTVLTTITGFLFPIHAVTPAVAVGVLCVPLLVVAMVALYVRRLSGRWLMVYASSAAALVYLNTLVLAAQLLMKVPALKEIAPSEKSPVFVVTQLVILVAFGVLGHSLWRSVRGHESKVTP